MKGQVDLKIAEISKCFYLHTLFCGSICTGVKEVLLCCEFELPRMSGCSLFGLIFTGGDQKQTIFTDGEQEWAIFTGGEQKRAVRWCR